MTSDQQGTQTTDEVNVPTQEPPVTTEENAEQALEDEQPIEETDVIANDSEQEEVEEPALIPGDFFYFLTTPTA